MTNPFNKKKNVTTTSKQINLVRIGVFMLLSLAIARLIYICLNKNVDGTDLVLFASNRNTVTKTLYAGRGTIYDASGDVLAQNVNSYTLIAYLSESRTTDINNPQHVVDKEATAEALAPILGMEKSEIIRILSKSAYQVEFGKYGKLNETQKEKIDELDLPGLDFIKSQTRYYKMGKFASYIIGYAKSGEDGEINGELGIESYYNNDLKGTNGTSTYQQDAYGYKMSNVPSYEEEATDGSDIYLTIDSNVQLILENGMKELTDNYELDWALFVVMDAKTGAIVGSATAPSFNPNDLSTITSYQNPLVSYTYEPGSTMKTFSWASAIDSGSYDGKKTYESGSITLSDGTVIKDSNKTGWGTITYDTGFAYSSNVGATRIALAMGKDTLTSYYQKLGFGQKTGIELSGEVKGTVNITYESELATAAFGQGISVTPIQMLQAYSTIANDGVMLKPYIVDKIVDKNGNVTYQGQKTELGQVFNKTTTDHMKELMYNMVYNGLTKYWRPSNVTLIAKTGTAQIASPKGGYLTGDYDYVRSLAGIFPKDNPRYIIYAVGQKMQNNTKEWSSIIVKMVEEIAAYSKITDSENKSEITDTVLTLDDYISQSVDEVESKLKSKKLKYLILGNGKNVINQYPNKNTQIYSDTRVIILTDGAEFAMPDLTGYSSNYVKIIFNFLQINVKITGYGYVNSQSVAAGEKINAESEIELVLEN